MSEINDSNNFCRVFELPEDYPPGFLFGGGKWISVKMVDWFNPIPIQDLPSWGGTPKPWSEYIPLLKNFLKNKRYVNAGRKYLLVADFGEAFIFESKEGKG